MSANYIVNLCTSAEVGWTGSVHLGPALDIVSHLTLYTQVVMALIVNFCRCGTLKRVADGRGLLASSPLASIVDNRYSPVSALTHT